MMVRFSVWVARQNWITNRLFTSGMVSWGVLCFRYNPIGVLRGYCSNVVLRPDRS